MPRLIRIAAAIAVVVGVYGSAPAGAANPVFQVTYNSGQEITVTANGTPVGVSTGPTAVIPPGTYDVVIVDPTNSLSFDLSGPGVSVLATKSPTTVTVTFQPGSSYLYQDTNEPAVTHRSFFTSGPVAAVTTTSPSGPGVLNTSIIGSDVPGHVVGTLQASLTSTGGISLTEKGKPVSKLTAGRYAVTVSDTSPSSGFQLAAAGKQAVAVTTSAFVGKHTVRLNLSVGRWTLSGLGGAKSFLVVKGRAS